MLQVRVSRAFKNDFLVQVGLHQVSVLRLLFMTKLDAL